MHSNKLYETKSSTFKKKRFENLCAGFQLVCIPEGGGHLNDVVHKKWNNAQQN